MLGKQKDEQTSAEAERVREVDLRPDGWERFKRAVDKALKTSPMHRKRAQSKPRVQGHGKAARDGENG